MSKRKILIVEDDLSILTGLSMNLRYEGYEILQAQDGQTDLVVLDVMLPQLNGFEVLRELRARGRDVPVVVLSAKGLETDKVMGLNLGADDYVVKPFSLPELLARVKAVLRRRYGEAGEKVSFDDVEMDLGAKVVTKAGKPVELTTQELKVLEHFLLHPGRVFSREELLAAAWGSGYEGTARTVDNFMSQLRAKLEVSPEAPARFVTVRGHGYRFDK
jgi:two-component system, OmpR family, alkaline phosphatase synthesis response regulator PhoP